MHEDSNSAVEIAFKADNFTNAQPNFTLTNIDNSVTQIQIVVTGKNQLTVTASRNAKNPNTWTVKTVNQDGALLEPYPNNPTTWRFILPPTEAWNEGESTLTITAYDQAGNKSDGEPLNVIVDTTPPKSPDIQLDKDSKTGSTGFEDENITNQNKPTLLLTKIDEDVIRLEIKIRGSDSEKTIKATRAGNDADWKLETTGVSLSKSGVLTFNDANKFAEGKHSLTVIAFDKANNQSKEVAPLVIEVDTQPPSPPEIKLNPSEDTLEGYKDKLTNKNKPSFSLKEIATDVTTITIEIVDRKNGTKKTIKASRKDVNDAWTLVSTPLESKVKAKLNKEGVLSFEGNAWDDDHYSLTVTALDKAGNKSAESNKLEIEIDTKKPDLPTIRLDEKSDSGDSSNDNITKETILTFTGIAEKNAIVAIFIDGERKGETTAGENGKWEWRMPEKDALGHGEYDITAQAKDRAGNKSEITQAIKLQIDTELAKPKITLVHSTDTEQDDRDHLTNKKPVTFTLNNIDEDVTYIGITIKNNTVGGEKTIEVRKTGTVWEVLSNGSVRKNVDLPIKQENGRWIFTTKDNPLIDGKYTLSVMVKDLAANEKTSDLLEVEVDTQPPEAPSIALDKNSHTGLGHFKQKNITNAKPPQFRLKDIAEDVTRILVKMGDSTISASRKGPNASWVLEPSKATLIKDQHNTGDWILTPGQELSHGNHEITVEARDRAGNKSDSSETLTIEVDIQPPPIPKIEMDGKSYSNGVNDDNATKKQQPRFNLIGVDDEVERLTLTVLNKKGDNVANVTINKDAEGKWVLSDDTFTKNEQDNLTFTPKNKWPDDNYTVKVKVWDKANNPADAQDLTMQVDTVAPDAATIVLDSNDGLEGYKNENLTRQKTPVFTINVAADVDSVEVSLDGGKNWITLEKQNKTSRLTYTTPELAERAHKLKVRVKDKAGNVNDSAELSFTLDLTPPAPPTIAMDSTSENDTGVSADDRLTKNQRPTFTLSNIDNSDVVAVEVHISHTIPGGNTPKISTVNATKNDKGQWTFQPKQNWEDGTYQLTVVALDKVGNKSKSDENSKVKVEIDTTLTLSVEMDTAKENDTGISNTDRLTNNPKPKFKLKFDKDLVELTISIIDSNGQPVGLPKVIKERLENGELPFSPDQDLLDGKYTIKLDAVDKAGNKTGDQSGDKKPITLSFEIDTYTKKPTIELVEPHPDHNNNTAKSLRPKFKGTAEAGSRVTIFAGGQEIDFIKAVPNSGNWEWQPKVPFKNNSTVSLIVKVIDKAGNSRDKNKSAAEETFQLIIPVLEVFPPTVELDASSDSGAKGDFITKETKPVLVITASPNTDVTVKVGNKNYENVKTDNEGKATLTLDNLDLEEGQFTHKFPVEVSIINPLDNKSLFAEDKTLVVSTGVDTKQWEIQIENLQKGGYINTATPNIFGTGEVDAKVKVFINKNQIGDEITVSENGGWQIKLPKLGKDGEYNLSIKVTNVAGHEKTIDFKNTLILDSVIEVPTIALDSASNTGLKNQDQHPELIKNPTTKTRKPKFVGTAEAGSKVSLYKDDDNMKGEPFAVTYADKAGKWEYNYPDELSDDQYSFVVKSEDKAKNSETSMYLRVTIDNETFIEAPKLTKDDGIWPTDNIIQNNKPSFHLIGERYQQVKIYLDNKLLKTLKIMDRNQKYTLEDALPDGPHTLRYEIEDLAGNIAKSELKFTVDTKNDTPVELTMVEGEIETEGKKYVSNITKNVVLKGTAEAGSYITMKINDMRITHGVGQKVSPSGVWTIEVNRDLLFKEGEIKVWIQSKDAANNESEVHETSFWVKTKINEFTVTMDDNLSEKSNELWSNKSEVTFKGTGDVGAIVSIMLGGQEWTSQKIQEDKNWQITLSDLPEDLSTLQFIIKDLAGNEQKIEKTIWIDSQPPEVPHVNEPIILPDGEQIAVGGRAEVGATVIITDKNGQELSEQVVGKNGKWGAFIDYPTDGYFTVVVKDKIGNFSEKLTRQITPPVVLPEENGEGDKEKVGGDEGKEGGEDGKIIGEGEGNENSAEEEEEEEEEENEEGEDNAEGVKIEEDTENEENKKGIKGAKEDVEGEETETDVKEIEKVEGKGDTADPLTPIATKNPELSDTQEEETSAVTEAEDTKESNLTEESISATDNNSIQLENSVDDQHTNSPRPTFMITPPEDFKDMTVLLDGDELAVETEKLNEQSISCTLPMPLEEGAYTLGVKFFDHQGGFSLEEKNFNIDSSSSDIVNTLDESKTLLPDTSTAPPSGQHADATVDNFFVDSMIQPIDDNDYER